MSLLCPLSYSYAHDIQHLRIYTVSQKIPDIFDCTLKTNYHILTIFDTNIPDTT